MPLTATFDGVTIGSFSTDRILQMYTYFDENTTGVFEDIETDIFNTAGGGSYATNQVYTKYDDSIMSSALGPDLFFVETGYRFDTTPWRIPELDRLASCWTGDNISLAEMEIKFAALPYTDSTYPTLELAPPGTTGLDVQCAGYTGVYDMNLVNLAVSRSYSPTIVPILFGADIVDGDMEYVPVSSSLNTDPTIQATTDWMVVDATRLAKAYMDNRTKFAAFVIGFHPATFVDQTILTSATAEDRVTALRKLTSDTTNLTSEVYCAAGSYWVGGFSVYELNWEEPTLGTLKVSFSDLADTLTTGIQYDAIPAAVS